MNRKKYIAAAAILLFCLLIAAAFYNGLTLTSYTVESSKITGPLRIVFLSDLHGCVYGVGQKNILEKINEQRPDLIVMTGDMAEEVMPIDGTVSLLKGLAGKYPCYYVSGNHEYWSNRVDKIKNIFRDYGVHVLEGESEIFEANGRSVLISGIDDPEIGGEEFQRQLETAAANASKNENLYSILLSHRPERFEQEAEHGFDLILSGHAHGGQWRLPFIPRGLVAPDQGFFPAYTAGKYFFDDSLMIVSRGLSRESTRIPRIFNPPEVIVIALESL